MTITDRTTEPADVFGPLLARLEAAPAVDVAADVDEERVAEAIYNADRDGGHFPAWDGARNVVNDDYRRLATAALAAMPPAHETPVGWIVCGPSEGPVGYLEPDWDGEVHPTHERGRQALADCHKAGYEDYRLYRLTAAGDADAAAVESAARKSDDACRRIAERYRDPALALFAINDFRDWQNGNLDLGTLAALDGAR